MKIKHPKIIGALSVLALALGGGLAYETSKHHSSNSETKLHSKQPDVVKNDEQDDKVEKSESKNSSSKSNNESSNNNDISGQESNDSSWIYGTPPELTGITYYAYNGIGEAIGSIEFNGTNIIQYAGHAHDLVKGNNVKYKFLKCNSWTFQVL